MGITFVEKMNDTTFDVVCDAGVELFRDLVEMLNRRGLGIEHAASILAVAAAGVAVGTDNGMPDITKMTERAGSMWRTEERNGEHGIVFDPPHRRPGYVAPAPTNTNTGN